ncbi:MAG: hypothetical protein RLZZ09_185, partial [Pseudomonadota bacterium]
MKLIYQKTHKWLLVKIEIKSHGFFNQSPHRFSRLAKEGGWIVLGQVASISGTLALVRVLTEMLEPKEYGKLVLGLSVGGVVTQVIMGGIVNAVNRYYSIATEQGDIIGYLKSAGRMVVYATLFATITLIAFVLGLVWLGEEQWLELTMLIFMLSIIGSLNSVLSGIQNAARQRSIVALHSGLDAWFKIVLAVGVMVWLDHTSTAVVIGYLLSGLLIVLSQAFFLHRFLRNSICDGDRVGKQNWLKHMWAYGWPFYAWGLFTWAQQISDRWALEKFATTEEVGQYAAVFQLGYAPIGIASNLLISFLGPILFQRTGDASDSCRNRQVRQITWRITWVTLGCTAFAFILTQETHAWFFKFLVGESYRAVSIYWPWVIVAGGLFAAGQTLSLQLMAEMQSAKMATSKIVTALLGITANVIGAKQEGVPGVIAALTIFSVVYFFWM